MGIKAVRNAVRSMSFDICYCHIKMFKVAILSLALFSVVLAETSLKVMPKGARPYVAQEPGVEVSRPEGALANSFYIPPDSGGNWGDNLWKSRVQGDSLITRETQINGLSNGEQQLNWNANFPNRRITHIRFLNIGRQRAYVESVSSSGGSTASAVIRIAANQQFRLLVEVYGR